MLSLLLWLLAAPAAAQTPPAQRLLAMPNRFPSAQGCPSMARQVMGDRRYPGTRLGDQPPGRGLLAVDRRLEGCPIATLISEGGRRQRR